LPGQEVPVSDVGQLAYQHRRTARPVHQSHRGFYNGDIDGCIDDFLVVLKCEARRLLRECAKQTPALKQFNLKFA
jgi:hypothetical protein